MLNMDIRLMVSTHSSSAASVTSMQRALPPIAWPIM